LTCPITSIDFEIPDVHSMLGYDVKEGVLESDWEIKLIESTIDSILGLFDKIWSKEILSSPDKEFPIDEMLLIRFSVFTFGTGVSGNSKDDTLLDISFDILIIPSNFSISREG